MRIDDYFTELLQWHRSMDHFDYDLVVDWALRLMEKGIESEFIVLLASCSKPVNRDGIRPYIYFALRELELAEKQGNGWIYLEINYLCRQLSAGNAIRKNLIALSDLEQLNGQYGLTAFWNLRYAWEELDDVGQQWYIHENDISLNNIEDYVKQAAKAWLDHYQTFLSTGNFVTTEDSSDWQLPAPSPPSSTKKNVLVDKKKSWYQFWK